MAKESKTAKASAVKVAPKPKETLTAEQAIAGIRSCRAGNLFVSNMEYIDLLLAEHDKALAEKAEFAKLYLAERSRLRAVARFLMLQVKEERRLRMEAIAGPPMAPKPVPEFSDEQVDGRVREIEEELEGK